MPWPLEMARVILRYLRAARIKYVSRASFTHGKNLSFGKGADIRPPNHIELGHHVSVGKNFTCEADLCVGDYVLISSNVSVVGKDHPFDDPDRTVYTQQRVDNSRVEI